ncbi:hypothetical protein B0T17DRAFT_532564 [Bombardia bombarda]|uniref:Uncharacterized protein n=1 Tax=Bombardia bombarda TaxID=252184 RepID=A0AA39X1C0_9PEZI|nr:hypothetical protein B0T17DRAFT_532564 [Bombardia bombarda]
MSTAAPRLVVDALINSFFYVICHLQGGSCPFFFISCIWCFGVFYLLFFISDYSQFFFVMIKYHVRM